MSKRIASQFWFGHFDTQDRFHAFVGEDPARFDEDRMDEDLPLSAFVASQGQPWLDHDFMEVAYAQAGGPIAARFAGASWAPFWGPILEERAAGLGVQEANALIFVMMDARPGVPVRRLIEAPRDARGEGFTLRYVGEIEHDDYA